MKLPALASLGHFRLVGSHEPARRVASQLFANPVPYLVVRNHDKDLFVFETNEWLFERLLKDGKLDACLELMKQSNSSVLKLAKLMSETRQTRSKKIVAPRLVVDAHGRLQSIVGQEALIKEDVVIYPSVTTEAKSVVRDELVEFAVKLRPTAPPGATTALDLQFEEGEETIPVVVTVTSKAFSRPAETEWKTEIKVARNLTTSPDVWNFKVRALDDRETYPLKVLFSAKGQPLGNIVVVLAHTGAADVQTAVSSTGPLAPFPRAADEPALSLTIREEGSTYRVIDAARGGTIVATARWNIGADGGYFSSLEAAQSLEEVFEVGHGVWTDLPEAIKDVLENDPAADKPLSIISHTPYAPFEIATLPLGKDGELLGARRPVLRWPEIAHVSPAQAQFDALLCIRPTYLGDDALPNALKEEELLEDLFPAEKRRRGRTRAELKPHLDDGSIHAIHFAGHAQTDPALLKLEGGDHVTSAFFFQTTQLMSRGRPFIFLNGCYAGAGRVATASGQGNMVHAFLSNKATASVAPAIAVDSEAALGVATTFYRAMKDGVTVGEAMRRVREAALGAPGPQIASYLSYLAYASPSLRLTWPA